MPAPARRPAPRDHLKTAQQREAENTGTTQFEWRGHTFTIATDPMLLPAKVMLAFEEDHYLSATKGMLGDEQWARIENTPMGELVDLFDALAAALGFGGAGESPASSA